ncbi:MAG TPA: hypothetical protein VJJ22_04540 [Candidatus Paceibacterota bacterium]
MPRTQEGSKVQIVETDSSAIARERLLSEIKQDTEGLDLARLERSYKNLGIPAHSYYLVFNERDKKKVADILKAYDLNDKVFLHKGWGTYYPELDLVLLIRKEKMEEANGSTYTESVLLHEWVHSTKQFANTEYGQGWFFEEGFADLQRVKYLAHLPKKKQASSVDILVKVPIPETELSFKLPSKYVSVGENGETTGIIPSIAAYGLEKLFAICPGLEQNLLEVRNGRQDLGSTKKLIDRVALGLFDRLMKLDYTAKDFLKGLGMITP